MRLILIKSSTVTNRYPNNIKQKILASPEGFITKANQPLYSAIIVSHALLKTMLPKRVPKISESTNIIAVETK